MISEPAPQTVQPQVQCRLIRSKWMFIEAEPDPTVPRSGSQYLLVRAHPEVHGPDGEIANMENCKPGRACYQNG